MCLKEAHYDAIPDGGEQNSIARGVCTGGNPFAGEATLMLDGVPHPAKLTLGALAELEAALATGSLVDLISRFEAQRFSTRDVLALVVAGLRGGGWQGTAAGLLRVDVGGGPGYVKRRAPPLWRLGRAGDRVQCASARITDPGRLDTSSASTTSPITLAVRSTWARSPSVGSWPR